MNKTMSIEEACQRTGQSRDQILQHVQEAANLARNLGKVAPITVEGETLVLNAGFAAAMKAAIDPWNLLKGNEPIQ